MSTMPPPLFVDEIVYPSSDGLPMADNDKQFRWIMVLEGNIAAMFRHAADVKVGGNMFWYPEEGHNNIRAAPDVYVVFGRPKGDRDSYLQWKEANVPMTVVFEVLSPSNDTLEMIGKQDFYQEYGVEEYYIYDPYTNRLHVYIRRGEMLRRVYKVDGFVSPKLGIRFDMSGQEMTVCTPDGQRFLTFEELKEAQEDAVERANQAVERANQAVERADQAEKRVGQLTRDLTRIKALNGKVKRGEASADDLAELDRLLGENGLKE